jgi:class 3 adenylate cyclase
VQFASVVCISFIKFAEWTETVAPTEAFAVLADVFGRFDAILTTKPSLVRVKMLGDLYVAAGGIFCEVNSPHEHATEALMFALEAVAALARFNEERGYKFALRIWQHIGGPVFVGVIGPVFDGDASPQLDEIIKPTFEVIGPAVSVALQLEETKGIANSVVMSRAVCPLIPRSQFSIVERSAVVGETQMRTTYRMSSICAPEQHALCESIVCVH